jgi:hypothetical protein
MQALVFDALTRGSCLAQLRDWLAGAEANGPPTTLRLSLHPRPNEASVLCYGEEAWGVIDHVRTVRHAFTPYGTFAEAAARLLALAAGDGGHWTEAARRRRGQRDLLQVKLPEIVGWVRDASSQIDRLAARQMATDIAVRAALTALAHSDLAAALAALAPTQDRGMPPLLGTLRALADLLAEVAGDDPPSYVTALERHARAVVEAAGLRLPPSDVKGDADAEPLAA